jgi:hypothetical protein
MTVWLPLALLVLISVLWLLRRQLMVVLGVALLAFYGIGFLAPFLDEAPRVVLALVGLGLFAAAVASIARVAPTKSSAAVAAFILVPLSLIALGYGVYEAHETGWHGLRQLGANSDAPGIGSFWLVFIVTIPFWVVVGLVIGAVAYVTSAPAAGQVPPALRQTTPPTGGPERAA